MTPIIDLQKHIDKGLDDGRGVKLSGDELDLLVSVGAYAVIAAAAVEARKSQCLQRSARNQSIKGGRTGSTADKIEDSSKSSGTTTSESASGAEARVLRMLPMLKQRSTGCTSKAKGGASAQHAGRKSLRKSSS